MIDGTYERLLDSQEKPDCWRKHNDYCEPHFHESLELCYVTRGRLRAVLNGEAYEVTQRQILISPALTVHDYEALDSCDSILLTVPPDFPPVCTGMFQKRTFAAHLYTDDAPDSELLRCLSLLADQFEQRKASSSIDLATMGYICVVLGLLAERVGLVSLPSGRNQSLVRKILNYLEENHTSPLTLEGVSLHFGYSKSRFSYLFHSYFGCSLGEYVNHLRCRTARRLLMRSGATLTQAAMEAGFESMRTFYRNFKRQYGVTPTEYLRRPDAHL